MRPYTFVYLVSGQGRLMDCIFSAMNMGIDSFRIASVISDRDCPAVHKARAHGVPAEIVQYRSTENRQTHDKKLFTAIEAYQPDGIILNYNRLISDPLLGRYSGRIINVHYALLPAFPGLNSVENARDYGVRFTGVTTHFIDAGMDTGPIIGQVVIPLDPNASIRQIMACQFRVTVPLLLHTSVIVSEGRARICGDRHVALDDCAFDDTRFSPRIPTRLLDLSDRILEKINLDSPGSP